MAGSPLDSSAPGSSTERPWLDGRQLEREALADAARQMKENLDGWLSKGDNRSLRAWILGQDTSPPR